MIRTVMAAVVLLTASAAPLSAQGPEAAPEHPKSMAGSWEFSNADREKTCTVTFSNQAAKIGKRLAFDQNCARLFPFVKEVIGWRLNDNDFLRLIDAHGNSVLEFSEVETGIFEAPKPGEGILFIQSPQDLGPPPKTAAQIAGEWSLVRRTGAPICALTLSNESAGTEFTVRVRPPCDPVVTRFAPVSWQIDRGEIVLHSADGRSWRFEEQEDAKWHRIPEAATPILMVRK